MQTETETAYQQNINSLVDYISTHLSEPISLESLAKLVHTSPFHLCRIFKYYMNEPLGAYIARQRVERAAMYLKTIPQNISNLTESVGYRTPQSFSKAFKQHFGMSASSFARNLSDRANGNHPEADSNALQPPTIVMSDEIQVVYTRIIGKYGDATSADSAWSKLGRFMKSNGLLSAQTRWIGISFDDPSITEQQRCRFYACGSVAGSIKASGEFAFRTIKAGKYAVFTHTGSYLHLHRTYDALQAYLQNRNELVLRSGLTLEKYINSPRNTPEDQLVTKIFIPIE